MYYTGSNAFASLRQGLVGAWCPSLPNGGSGNTLPDVSGYGNHGTLTNMSSDDWVSSQYGRALDFDGVNDWVLMQGTQNAYNVGSGDFALFTWFRSTAAGTQSIFLLDNNSTGNGLILFAFGNILRTWVAGVRTDSTTVINDGAWKHVGMVRRSGTVTQYINGIAGNTFTSAGSALTGQTPRIGSYDGSNFMLTGQVDDARFYSRALTEPEIRLLASRPGIGLRQESHRQTFYQFPSGARRKRILTGMP